MLSKKEQRLRRSRQTRIRIATQRVARLTVNRTNLHIYANLISDDGSKVLASASTMESELRSSLGGSGKGGNAERPNRWDAASRKKRVPWASRKWRLTALATLITAG